MQLLVKIRHITVKDIKWSLYQCFECPKHVAHIAVHLVVCFVVVTSLAISLFIETSSTTDEDLVDCLFTIELILTIYFSAELILRLWVVGVIRKYRGLKGRLRYMTGLNFSLDVTILSSTVVLCHALTPGNRGSKRQQVENLCFVHLLRFLHLDRSGYTWGLLKQLFVVHRTELTATVQLAFLTIVFISCALSWMESDNNPDSNMSEIGNSLYFTLVMYLTIGYGDVVPMAWFSKLFASIMCWLAISLLGVTSSIFAVGLALLVQDKKLRKQHERIVPAAIALIQAHYRLRLMRTKFEQIPIFKTGFVQCMIADELNIKKKESAERFVPGRQEALKWVRTFSLLSLKLLKHNSEREFDQKQTQDENTTAKQPTDTASIVSDEEDRVQRKIPIFFFEALPGSSAPDQPRTDKEENVMMHYVQGNFERVVCSRRTYELAIIFIWELKFLLARKRFNKLLHSPDLAEVSMQMSESQTSQLQRLTNVQLKIDKLLGVPVPINMAQCDIGQHARESSIFQRLNAVHNTIAQLEEKTDNLHKQISVVLTCLKSKSSNSNSETSQASLPVQKGPVSSEG